MVDVVRDSWQIVDHVSDALLDKRTRSNDLDASTATTDHGVVLLAGQLSEWTGFGTDNGAHSRPSHLNNQEPWGGHPLAHPAPQCAQRLWH